jgi:hypothetical protein
LVPESLVWLCLVRSAPARKRVAPEAWAEPERTAGPARAGSPPGLLPR